MSTDPPDSLTQGMGSMREALSRLLISTSSRNRPWQISAAVAVGVLAGLLPKSSALFVGVLAFAYCAPLHLPLLAATALALSLITPSLDVGLERVGVMSLTHPSTNSFWLQLDAFPLVPWLSLHDARIHGAALVGCVLLLPIATVVRLSLIVLDRPIVLRRSRPSPIIEVASSEPPPITANASTIVEAAAESGCAESHETTISQIERILASYDALDSESTDASERNQDSFYGRASTVDDVIRRASRMVAVVDDILNTIDIEAHGEGRSDGSQSPTTAGDKLCSAQASTDRSPEQFEQPEQPARSLAGGTQAASSDMAADATPSEPLQSARALRDTAEKIGGDQRQLLAVHASNLRLANPHAAHVSARLQSTSSGVDGLQTTIREAREGEALRNLLNHLRELKEKV